MKRRRFVKALAALPAAPLISQQQPPPAAAPQTPVATPPAGGRGGGRGFAQQIISKLENAQADTIGEPAQRFFTAPQYSALRKLCETFMPPMRGNPGAIECGVPELLDFLLGVSPADRQKLYRSGLDTLNARAKKQFNKSFSECDGTQADAVIRPLLAPVPWVYDPPKDPAVHFVTTAHRDIRTASQNSREWANAGAASGQRGGGFGGGGMYLNPIDPIYRG